MRYLLPTRANIEVHERLIDRQMKSLGSSASMDGQTAGATHPTILLQGGTLVVHAENDHVHVLSDTDLAIQGGKIAKIGPNIGAGQGTLVIDCSNKIISPGFIDW